MLEGIGASTLVGMLLWAGWAVGSFVADYILSWHRDRYIKRICARMAVVDLVYENAKRTEIAAEWIGCSTASLPDYAVAVKAERNDLRRFVSRCGLMGAFKSYQRRSRLYL